VSREALSDKERVKQEPEQGGSRSGYTWRGLIALTRKKDIVMADLSDQVIS
jgi:hypothetical protein